MNNESVIILHGLGETSQKMSLLHSALRQAGYRTTNVEYPSTRFPVQILTEQVAEVIERQQGATKLHFVTHSLGGILVRHYLQHHHLRNLGRVVMLTPPNQGSEFFEVYRHVPLTCLLLGPVVQQSGKGEDCFMCHMNDVIDYPVGIIAGCLPVDPLSWPVIGAPHDGRVTVESTMLEGMADHVLLPTSHELVMFNPLAIMQVLHFLEHGKFLHTALTALPYPANVHFPESRPKNSKAA